MAKKQKRSSSGGASMALFAVGVLALVAIFGYAMWDSVFKEKPADGAAAVTGLEGIQTFTSEGNGHVADGTKITYKNDPPTSGDHYQTWVLPGFYTAPQANELLVHSLEHGYVIIYYNKAKLSDADMGHIRSLTNAYKGQWDGVVAIPRDDAQNAVVLTAWNNMLKMPTFDKDKMNAFVDKFRGRGPENPVR